MAERIILIEDRDAADAQILGQMIDHGRGLFEIGGAQIDHFGLIGLAQELCPGEGADEGHPGLARDRLDRDRCWRADRSDQGKDMLLADQLARRRNRPRRFVAIIDRAEIELAAFDAAGLVRLGKGGLDAFLHAAAESARGTGQRCGLAEQDAMGADAIHARDRFRLARCRQIQHGAADRECCRQCQGVENSAHVLTLPSPNALPVVAAKRSDRARRAAGEPIIEPRPKSVGRCGPVCFDRPLGFRPAGWHSRDGSTVSLLPPSVGLAEASRNLGNSPRIRFLN